MALGCLGTAKVRLDWGEEGEGHKSEGVRPSQSLLTNTKTPACKLLMDWVWHVGGAGGAGSGAALKQLSRGSVVQARKSEATAPAAASTRGKEEAGPGFDSKVIGFS